jgi:hypothetical protein
MYDIIFLIIALVIVIIISYQVMKKYKKNKKEGFTIPGQSVGALMTTSISDPATYITQLTSIISNLKSSLNLDTNRDSYVEILALQHELIQLCLLNKFINYNLNYSDDFLISLSDMALSSTQSNGSVTGATVVFDILETTNNNTTVQSILSDLFI